MIDKCHKSDWLINVEQVEQLYIKIIKIIFKKIQERIAMFRFGLWVKSEYNFRFPSVARTFNRSFTLSSASFNALASSFSRKGA